MKEASMMGAEVSWPRDRVGSLGSVCTASISGQKRDKDQKLSSS